MLLGLWKANLKSTGAFLTRSIHLINGKVYYTHTYIYIFFLRQSNKRVAVSILDLLKTLQAPLLQKMDQSKSCISDALLGHDDTGGLFRNVLPDSWLHRACLLE